MQIAREMGITVVEKNLEPYDVMIADEAFMTATPFCILPVTRFKNENIGSGVMGPMTQKLLNRWSEDVGVNIVDQIKEYGKEVSQLKTQSASPYVFKSSHAAQLGFIQGRLSPIVDGKIQAFPWQHWREEFPIAHEIGLRKIEWTLDQDRLHENPFIEKSARRSQKSLK